MAPKTKAIEIEFSDGSKGYVHAPTFPEMALYLQALPALAAWGKAISALASLATGEESPIIGLPAPEVSDHDNELVCKLLAKVSDLPREDFDRLPYADAITIFHAFGQLTPKNQEATQPEMTPTPESALTN